MELSGLRFNANPILSRERREEAREDLSPEQAELIRDNERLRRQLARNNMTPEQRQLFQERNALYRHLQQIGGLSTESGIVERNEYKENVREITPQDISGNIQVEECIQACQESLSQTILHEEEADYEENKENCALCHLSATARLRSSPFTLSPSFSYDEPGANPPRSFGSPEQSMHPEVLRFFQNQNSGWLPYHHGYAFGTHQPIVSTRHINEMFAVSQMVNLKNIRIP